MIDVDPLNIDIDQILGYQYNSYNSNIVTSYKLLSEEEFDGLFTYNLQIRCKPTWGNTIGFIMRRVCLTSIPGFAPIAFKINGASHMFDQVNGIRETVGQLALNLRKLCIFSNDPDEVDKDVFVFSLKKNTPGEVFNSDFTTTSDLEIFNKNELFCYLDINGSIDLKFLVTKGIGYRSASNHNMENLPNGYFLIDTNFSPIVKCTYIVKEDTSLRDEFDVINMSITVKRQIDIKILLKEIVDTVVRELTGLFEVPQETSIPVESNTTYHKWSNVNINDTNINIRAKNALSKAGLNTIQDILDKTLEEIQAINGMGISSFEDVVRFLKENSIMCKTGE